MLCALASEWMQCLQLEVMDMKRIIDGVTYNTDTATIAARWEYKDRDDYDKEATLYQTRGGAFFVVHEWEVGERAKVWFESMARDEVVRLVERTDNLAIINDEILGEPPEAAEESSPASTIYVRVPGSLKNQIETAAANAKLSVNAWAIRCMERCIADRTSIAGTVSLPAATDALFDELDNIRAGNKSARLPRRGREP
jgi:hypothetical protein